MAILEGVGVNLRLSQESLGLGDVQVLKSLATQKESGILTESEPLEIMVGPLQYQCLRMAIYAFSLLVGVGGGSVSM